VWQSIIQSVLGYVDRPWRALFILVILLVGGAGFFVYEHRADIVQAWLQRSQQPGTLTIGSEAELSNVIDDMFVNAASTGVDAIAIWSVDIGGNRAALKIGKRSDGTPWKITPTVLQWVHPEVNTPMLTRLFKGESSCDDPRQYSGTLSGSLIAEGFVYICYTPEPPNNKDVIVGLVALAWRTKPSEQLVRSALTAVLQETDRIVWRK
jgi:hypothetical protein